MGSKRKLLPFIDDVLSDIEFDTCLDAFSGSGVVSYYLKCIGKEVMSNDLMSFPSIYTLATIENKNVHFDSKLIKKVMKRNSLSSNFISDTFQGLYFTDKENQFLDSVRTNLDLVENKYQKAIGLSALVRACLKKRPRGIFTYVGHRYDDGRKDLRKDLEEHFIENLELFNKSVFDNGKSNKSFNQDIFTLDVNPDLVYIDPPYYSKSSDNDYTRRYHFVEGLVKNWDGLEIQHETKTKKFKKYNTPFDKKSEVHKAFATLIEKFRNSVIVISYSSNSIPEKDDMISILREFKENVEVHQMDYTYSFGNQGHKINDNMNKVQEFLFVAK